MSKSFLFRKTPMKKSLIVGKVTVNLVNGDTPRPTINTNSENRYDILCSVTIKKRRVRPLEYVMLEVWTNSNLLLKGSFFAEWYLETYYSTESFLLCCHCARMNMLSYKHNGNIILYCITDVSPWSIEGEKKSLAFPHIAHLYPQCFQQTYCHPSNNAVYVRMLMTPPPCNDKWKS